MLLIYAFVDSENAEELLASKKEIKRDQIEKIRLSNKENWIEKND